MGSACEILADVSYASDACEEFGDVSSNPFVLLRVFLTILMITILESSKAVVHALGGKRRVVPQRFVCILMFNEEENSSQRFQFSAANRAKFFPSSAITKHDA